MQKKELKVLYKQNRKLALQVAKALGYKIVPITVEAKDLVATKITDVIQSILGFKPRKIKIKKKDNKITYLAGELTEDTDQIIIKITKRDDSVWEFVVGIPNIGKGPGDAFLKAGRAKDDTAVLKMLMNVLKQAKNFLKIRGFHIDKNGYIVEGS